MPRPRPLAQGINLTQYLFQYLGEVQKLAGPWTSPHLGPVNHALPFSTEAAGPEHHCGTTSLGSALAPTPTGLMALNTITRDLLASCMCLGLRVPQATFKSLLQEPARCLGG